MKPETKARGQSEAGFLSGLASSLRFLGEELVDLGFKLGLPALQDRKLRLATTECLF